MILLLALALSVGIALARGGDLRRLAAVPLRLGWLAIIAFAIQLVEIYFPLPAGSGLSSPRVLLLMATYAVVLAVVVANRHLPGVSLMGVGLLLNLAVMVANDGYMPITLEALQRAGFGHLALGAEPGARILATKDIVLPQHQTRLWLLSDIIVLPATLPVSSAFSLGDVALALGVCWFFQRTMLPPAAAPERAS